MVLSPRLAESLLFQPSRGDPGPPPPISGIGGERLALLTADGVEIQGWWYPVRNVPGGAAGSDSLATSPDVPPAVLFLHGNAGDISHRTGIAGGLIREGVSVLLLEYRGYGGSAGSPSEEGLHLDAVAGYEFLLDRLGGPERIVVFGRSMGGGVAARLAASHPAAGLILESAFTSLEAMARTIYPFVPGFLFRRLRGRFDTLARVREVGAPIMVVHGSEDEIVPLRMGSALLDAAGPGAVWMEVPGARHNDVFWVGGDAYFAALAGFIRRSVEAEPRA